MTSGLLRRVPAVTAGEDISEKFNELPQGRTAEIAAGKAGFGNENTYRQARLVVQNASPELVEAELKAQGELRLNLDEAESGKRTDQIAAEKAGFGNKDTYRQAKTVVQNASPELVEAMDNGSIAISTAARLVDALVEVQQRARQACGQGGILLRANLREATVG